MNAQVKAKPDDTRARIIETADAMFRRLGYAKTAVADIAGELGMSPANVYRFFASKNAICSVVLALNGAIRLRSLAASSPSTSSRLRTIRAYWWR